MNKELRDKIIKYNLSVQEKAKKSEDMDILIGALSKLPPGQLQKILTDDVIAVIEKYTL